MVPTAIDAAAGGAHRVEAVGGGGVDPAPFGVHPVVVGVVGLDRQEGARADVERQRRRGRSPPPSSAAISAGVKCSAAVGAATAPGSAANIVW